MTCSYRCYFEQSSDSRYFQKRSIHLNPSSSVRYSSDCLRRSHLFTNICSNRWLIKLFRWIAYLALKICTFSAFWKVSRNILSSSRLCNNIGDTFKKKQMWMSANRIWPTVITELTVTTLTARTFVFANRVFVEMAFTVQQPQVRIYQRTFIGSFSNDDVNEDANNSSPLRACILRNVYDREFKGARKRGNIVSRNVSSARKRRNICWGSKMFLKKFRNSFASRLANFASATNVSWGRKRGNICFRNNVSSFAGAFRYDDGNSNGTKLEYYWLKKEKYSCCRCTTNFCAFLCRTPQNNDVTSP